MNPGKLAIQRIVRRTAITSETFNTALVSETIGLPATSRQALVTLPGYINGALVELTFTAELSVGALDTAAWVVTDSLGSPLTTSVATVPAVSPSHIVALTVTPAAAAGDVDFAVAYTPSGTNDLLDTDGNAVPAFAEIPLVNADPSAAGGSAHVIEDEGTPVTNRANMNFTGAGVSVADSGGKTVVTIAGGADVSLTVSSGTTTIAADTCRVVAGRYTIADGAALVIADTGVLAVL